MAKRKAIKQIVTWLSDEITKTENVSNSFHYYEKFQFKKITAGIGDFVLVSNADSAEPDTEEGCDAAQILHLYEDTYNKTDPFRAKVQWYSKPCDLPNWCFNSKDPINFIEREVVQDHRPFDTDVSIETFFKKCEIVLTFTKDGEFNNLQPYHYICRYRLTLLSKRKGFMEPVMEQERDALKLLCTPNKPIASPRNCSKTPTSLVKKMSSISLSDQKDWSVSKNNGTKLLLKRAILADTTEKKSPMKSTPKSLNQNTETPKANKVKKNFEDIILAELGENSDDDELPTLIIKKVPPSTPKRKQSVSKAIDETPKKMLIYEDNNQAPYSTRSGRTIRNTVSYRESELSPVKKTPKKLIHKFKIDEDSDDDFKPALRTPKTPKTPRTPRSTATTPRNKITRRIITSQLTPTLKSRAHSIDNSSAFLNQDESLPGREKQMEEILSFVRSKLLDGVSGCMYISGVPGTGKTATVCKALKILKEEVDLPDFQLVEVNGMKIAEPRQAYVQIYKQLTGKSVVWEQACSLLEKRFTTPGPRRTPTVLLVDELDALCTRRQDVLYSIMEWASRAAARLAVLAVANTMDLPERALAARVASRLGLARLPFAPYTHAQLQRIVAARLAAAGATVAPDAVQLIARKVASVSGDARRALALCSRALELGGAGGGGGGGGGAGMREVQLALAEAASSATARAVRACAPAERLMLRAIAAEVERTGSDETTLSRALRTAAALAALDGRPYRAAPRVRAPTPAQARAACARLADTRLLVLEPMPADAKLLLNVSTDDVHYATRQIAV